MFHVINSTVGSHTKYMHQSVQFNEARSNAQVPFLHHQILEFSYNGMEHTIQDHDITIRIPEGAVDDGILLHLEVGVAAYGPFIFPENTLPISPITWLCLMEGDAKKLKKPFHLILPHFLTELSKERLYHHEVGFAKADHNNYTFDNDQIKYKFNQCEIQPLFAFSRCKSYGVLKSNHCCFYCLKAKQTPEVVKDAGYCLTQIESILVPQQRYEVHFVASYFLNTCVKVRFIL